MPSRSFLRAVVALIIPFLCTLSPAHAEEPAPGRPVRRPRPAQERIKRLEARIQELEAALKSSEEPAPGGRFQMVVVGNRAVILDTQTGQTQILDPAAEAFGQRLEIGKAWVAVAVQVHVGERRKFRPKDHPRPSAP